MPRFATKRTYSTELEQEFIGEEGGKELRAVLEQGFERGRQIDKTDRQDSRRSKRDQRVDCDGWTVLRGACVT